MRELDFVQTSRLCSFFIHREEFALFIDSSRKNALFIDFLDRENFALFIDFLHHILRS